MVDEPGSLILRMLRDMRAEMGDMRADVGEIKTGLRRAVVDYHTSVIGHGIIISEIEARVRRVEQHLNLPAIDAH